MASDTGISWTEATWNPWHGCRKVSEGCKYCYMFREKHRYGQDPMEVVKSKTKFKDPLKWKEGKMVFTCSWSDWFIELADEWREEAWDIIRKTPQHTYQILTKRPELVMERLPKDWGKGWDNVWLGVSAENNQRLSDRVRILDRIPAKVKFLSIEPLLEEMMLLPKILANIKIDWVIVGGESGNISGEYRYRFCSQRWIERIVQTCKEHNVPVFVKQLGTHISILEKMRDWSAADMSEFPKHLQVREFPNKLIKPTT